MGETVIGGLRGLWRSVTGAQGPNTGTAERRFRFEYSTTITAADCESAPVDVWIPVGSSDAAQTIGPLEVRSPIPWTEAIEPRFGNRMVHACVPAGGGTVTLVTAYDVLRKRVRVAPPPTGATYPADPRVEWARHLGADAKVPVDGFLAEQAKAVASTDDPPLLRLRKIYDHLMETLEYDKRGCTPDRADELGNLQVACDLQTGTCTEFHGLLVGYCRALGIPARFEFGFNVPFDKTAGNLTGYHCWSQVLLPQSGWFPVDVTEAIKERARGSAPREADFFFGGLNSHRVRLSHGRDVPLVPPAPAPLDKLIFSHAVRGGEELHPMVAFHFDPPRG